MRHFARARNKENALRVAAENKIDDAVVLERINRSMRRRMSDELVTLIRRACMCGHAHTAKGLWVVLHDLIAREAAQHFPHGRRPDEKMLDTLALEIAAAVKNNRPAP